MLLKHFWREATQFLGTKVNLRSFTWTQRSFESLLSAQDLMEMMQSSWVEAGGGKVIGWCVLVHRTRWLCCKLFYMNSNQDPIVIALSLAHLAVSNSITHCPVFWSHRNARFQYCMFQVWNAIAIHCYFHLPILGGLNASSWCARNLLGQLQVWARPSLKSSWEMKWTTQMTTLGVICGM